jgi:hypothetical protein
VGFAGTRSRSVRDSVGRRGSAEGEWSCRGTSHFRAVCGRFHRVTAARNGGERESISVAVKRSTIIMAPPHRGQVPTAGAGGSAEDRLLRADGLGRGCEQLEAERQESGPLAVGEKPEVSNANKARGSRWSRKRRRNSSTGRVSRRFLFLWAESRQRKVTLPSANETSR